MQGKATVTSELVESAVRQHENVTYKCGVLQNSTPENTQPVKKERTERKEKEMILSRAATFVPNKCGERASPPRFVAAAPRNWRFRRDAKQQCVKVRI